MAPASEGGAGFGGTPQHRLVQLRPVRPDDVAFLYDIATDWSTGITWRFRGATPSHEAFARQLWDGIFVQYLVVHAPTMEPIGLTGLYNMNATGRHAYCFAATSSRHVNSGLVLVGAAALITRAFDLWGLTKVYVEMPEYNLPSVGGIAKYATEEGRLRAHEQLWGRWWDLILYAIYPKTWQSARDLLLPGGSEQ